VLTLSITTIAKSGSSSTGEASKIQEHLDKTPTPSPIGGRTAPAAAPATGDTTKK
jgi:preprotein translocase subunit SecG